MTVFVTDHQDEGDGTFSARVHVKFLSDHQDGQYIYLHLSHENVTIKDVSIEMTSTYENILKSCFQIEDFANSSSGFRTSEIVLEKSGPITATSVASVLLSHIAVETHKFCVYDVQCSDISQFTRKNSTANSLFDPTQQKFYYDSLVRYNCGVARAFITSDGTTTSGQEFLCDWQGQWQSDEGPMNCKCEWKPSRH